MRLPLERYKDYPAWLSENPGGDAASYDKYAREELRKNDYTVIGFWAEDDPLVVGIVEGDVPLVGPYSDVLDDDGRGFRGPWATAVRAPDPGTAMTFAVTEMESTLNDDDDDDDEEDEDSE